MGVTGARTQTSAAAPELVLRVREVAPSALVGVGLGVSNGEQAREVASFADLVIVGSALVKTLLDAEETGRPEDLTGLRAVVADLAAGVRAGPTERNRERSAAVASGTSQRSPGLVGT
jgi:tryptophan synthase alpha chain